MPMAGYDTIRKLLNKVYAYKGRIENNASNSVVPINDADISSYVKTKEKCLNALQDVLTFTKSYAIVSEASEDLTALLSKIASPIDLTWEVLNKATDLCEDIKKDSLIHSVTNKYQRVPRKTFSGSDRFQQELPVLKHILWFSDVHFTCRNIDWFLDPKLYDSMDIKQVQLVIAEINRLQEYFFSDEWSRISIPRRFFKFFYKLKELFLHKEKLFYDLPSTKHSSFVSKPVIEKKPIPAVESVPLDAAALHKRAETDFALGNYVRARDLCYKILTSFPDYESLPDILKMLENIKSYIESIKQTLSHNHTDNQSIEDASTPTKKIDPRKIDPHTWRPYDDFG